MLTISCEQKLTMMVYDYDGVPRGKIKWLTSSAAAPETAPSSINDAEAKDRSFMVDSNVVVFDVVVIAFLILCEDC